MATTIKVATVELIKLLEARLAESEAVQAELDKVKNKEKQELSKWATAVYQAVVKNKCAVDSARVYSSNKIEINFELDDKVKLPPKPEGHYGYGKRVENEDRILSSYDRRELENTITLLKLTNEPTVSASTYKSIAKYL